MAAASVLGTDALCVRVRVPSPVPFIGYPSEKGTEASEKVGGLQPIRNVLGLRCINPDAAKTAFYRCSLIGKTVVSKTTFQGSNPCTGAIKKEN